MIAIAKEKTDDVTPSWHDDFLDMLPAIRQHATIAFRELDAEAKEEAVQETICNSMRAYVRLVELGKTHLAYATPLAQFAIRQIHAGRQVGCSMNVKDVSSKYAQRAKGITIQSLHRYDRDECAWREILVEDKTAGPAEVAGCRIDFRSWLNELTERQRIIANLLAVGETTKAVATQVGVTDGRVSQVRRELMEAWREFQGELAVA